MKVKSFIVMLLSIASFSVSKGQSKGNLEEIDGIEIHNFESLQPLLNKNNDTTYVINFWATWCKPCVAELPHFEALHSNYKDQKMQMILVSLDFPNALTKRLIPFVESNDLQSRVILLNDPDSNSWIPKIDGDWSGAIPATYIYRNNRHAFFEQSFDYAELEQQFLKFLNTDK